MLEEVCETVLVISLLVCTNVSCKVEFSSLSWLVIVADVVCQTVLELTCPDSVVIRKRSLSESNRSGENGRNENK